MKVTRVLIYIAYFGLIISLIAVGIFGFIVSKNDLNNRESEKNRFPEVSTRSTTAKYEMPMDLSAEYYFRKKDGKVLIDSYFLKIQKKYLPDSYRSQSGIPETDYPLSIEGNFYSMPEINSYLYIQTPFSTLEHALTIWKFYLVLSFALLGVAILLTIRFLKNCDRGNFFDSQNAGYLRAISYVALGYTLMDYGIQWLVVQEMNSQLESSFAMSLNSNLEFNWSYLIFSLFLVFIAQAFTEGTKLKEEQSLTI